MKLKELIADLAPLSVRGNTEVEVKGLAVHSRRVEPGYLFFAIRGERYDGADFILEAKDRGAVGIVLREFFPLLNQDLVQIRVPDPTRTLAALSNKFFSYPAQGMKMIGITGTNGKTTVAVLTRTVLEVVQISTGLLGTINYQIGERSLPAGLTTPAPPYLQMLLQQMKTAGCSHVVMEVSSHALKQGRVAGIEFQTALFTNLSREHLDFHQSLEDYQAAKAKLFNHLHRGELAPQEKLAILNQDDPFSQRIRQRVKTPVLTYGLNNGADLRATEILLSEKGSSFRLDWMGKSFRAQIALLGQHNVYNALAAIALTLSEGIPMKKILSALGKISRIPGRMEQVGAGQNFHILIDYAHTPDALEKVLRASRSIFRARIIVVFGCGGDRDRSKRPLMGEVAVQSADEVVVTSDNPRSEEPGEIINEILSGGWRRGESLHVVEDRREAIRKAFSRARKGDVVVIAGKGHEHQQIFRDRIIPFDDREVAAEIVRGLIKTD